MGLFDSPTVDFSGAENIYDQSMQKILELLKNSQAQGRTDITSALSGAADLNKPYIEAGKTSTDAWLSSLGLGPKGAAGANDLRQQFQEGPGFQYALQTAQNALNRQSAATGQNLSGAAMLQAQRQAQGQAQQGWENWLGNYQGNLARISGMGQQSAGQQAGFGMEAGNWLSGQGLQYAGMSSNVMSEMAKAKAEAEMAQQMQNAQSSGNWLSSIGSTLGSIGGFMFGSPGFGSQGKGAMDWLSKMFH